MSGAALSQRDVSKSCSGDDGDDEYVKPTSLLDVQRSVMRTAEQNETLRRELNAGATLLSLYHAQLGIDSLREERQLADIRQQLEQATQEEASLRQRIAFLHQDCRRLETDNETIRAGFEYKDRLIQETIRLIELEEEKFRDGSRLAVEVQDGVLKQSRILVDLKNELREKKRQQLRLRQQQWESTDDADRLAEAMQLVREEMTYLQQRIQAIRRSTSTRAAEKGNISDVTGGADAGDEPQHAAGGVLSRSTSLRGTPHVGRSGVTNHSLSSAIRSPTPNNASSPPAVPRSVRQQSLSTSTRERPPSPSSRPVGPGGCRRPDCVAVALRLSTFLGSSTNNPTGADP